MTDYLYSLSLAKQTMSFFLSLGLGFIMGLVYDIFRLFRILFSKGKVGYFITDILYCIVFSFCTFLFFITVNEGQLRFYLLAGEILGFIIYYFSLGIVIFRFFDRVIASIRNIFKKIFLVISKPFILVFSKIKKLFTKNVKKSRKNLEKVKNKSIFHLKIDRSLLYNLYVKKHNAVKDCESDEREV